MATEHSHHGGKMEKSDNNDQGVSRRGFFKKIAIGGAAVGVSAGLFKVADAIAPDVDQQLAQKQDADVIAGDQALAKEEYVQMSKGEKDKMVQMFISNYPKKNTGII